MKMPPSDRANDQRNELSSEPRDFVVDDVRVDDVLFEMGMIIAAHLTVAFCVVLTLRLFG